MKKNLLLLLATVLINACAYSDLKAPCGDTFAALDTVPCDKPQPVGLAFNRSHATTAAAL